MNELGKEQRMIEKRKSLDERRTLFNPLTRKKELLQKSKAE